MSATARPPFPAYDQVEQWLTASPLLTGAAEAHGVFCGLLAAGAPDPETRWLAEVLPPTPTGAGIDLAAQECRQALQTVAAHTRAQLGSAAMNFDLLLPDEDRSLLERATGVHDWSRGFLFGAGLAGLDRSGLSGPSQEALADLLELTRMDLDALAEPGLIEHPDQAPTVGDPEASDPTSDPKGGDLGVMQTDQPDQAEGGGQANEQALAEIIEFLRVAALMIYEDTAPKPQREDTAPTPPRRAP